MLCGNELIRIALLVAKIIAAHIPVRALSVISTPMVGAKMLAAESMPKPVMPVIKIVLRLVISEIFPNGRLIAAMVIVYELTIQLTEPALTPKKLSSDGTERLRALDIKVVMNDVIIAAARMFFWFLFML